MWLKVPETSMDGEHRLLAPEPAFSSNRPSLNWKLRDDIPLQPIWVTLTAPTYNRILKTCISTTGNTYRVPMYGGWSELPEQPQGLHEARAVELSPVSPAKALSAVRQVSQSVYETPIPGGVRQWWLCSYTPLEHQWWGRNTYGIETATFIKKKLRARANSMSG